MRERERKEKARKRRERESKRKREGESERDDVIAHIDITSAERAEVREYTVYGKRRV